MDSTADIQFLINHEIDREKWDSTIQQSSNQLIYASAFYLDNMANGWHALASRNFDWVLPLTQKTKFGFTYLYQPPFTQQLGVFAKPGAAVPYRQIIQFLQAHYRYWDFNWNYLTPIDFMKPGVYMHRATNYILDLSKGYTIIAGNYNSDLVKNLKRNRRHPHAYRTSDDYNKCIGLYRKYYGSRMLHVKETDYKNFSEICSYAKKNELLICREVVDEQGITMAAILLLSDGSRMYNLMNTTTAEGRKTAANHFLIDAVIKEFSGKDLVLDFEGSDLPGVKEFYRNFNTVNQPYFICRYNNLPWPLRIFKK